MSLLQDALRRSQRQAGASTPPPPAPLPDGGSPAKPGTRWKLLAAILGAAFAVGIAGVFLLTHRGAPPPTVLHVPPAVQAVVPAPPATSALPSPGAASSPGGPKGDDGPSRSQPARKRAPASGSPASAPAAYGSFPTAPSISRGTRAAAMAAGKDTAVEKFNAGIAALNRGDAEEAARLLREVTASSPDLVEGWNALGLALLRRNRLDEADAAFARLLSLSPRYVPGMLNAGLLRLAQGRTGEGAGIFARAADLSPGTVAPRVNLAVAQARLGRLGEAEETLLAADRRFPAHPDVLYHLGTVYERSGNRSKGADAYASFLAASAGSNPSREEQVRERLRAWGLSR